jgi:hypothetical protein
MSLETNLTAEQKFRQAFERLKEGKPRILEPGASVSQNNVAKEAECDPSALRKSRFPSLIREIQAYIEINKQNFVSKRQKLLIQRSQRVDLKKKLELVIAQRDLAQSQLVSAHLRLLELASELAKAQKKLDEFQPVSILKT